MPFFGHAEARLDDKNRVAIPAKFRHDFGDGAAYLMASEDGCIFMYTESSFEATREEVKLNPRTTPAGRAARRAVFENTERVSPDSQGRVVVPSRLLEKLSITGPCDLTVIGNDEWVEVWETSAYRAQAGGR
jgi:MraZ protein